MFRISIFVNAIGVLIAFANQSHLLSAAENDLSVQLRTTKESYVIGEPIVLRVRVQNNIARELEFRRVFGEEYAFPLGIEIYWSGNGEQFREFQNQFWPAIRFAKRYDRLKARESKLYELRLLYSYNAKAEKGRLQFHSVGKYSLKVRFPYTQFGVGRIYVDSNVVAVEIKKPTGHDLEVWRKINSDDVFYFVQRGGVPPEENVEIVDEIAKLLLTKPESIYHKSLRYALKRYYYFFQSYNSRLTRSDTERWNRIREAIGLTVDVQFHDDLADQKPNPENHILDLRTVRVHYVEPVEVRKVLSDVSNQCGVSLSAEFHLGRAPFLSLQKKAVTLREFMQSLVDPGRTYWIPDGDGYVLTPVELNKSNQSQPAPNDATDNETESPDLRTDANDEDR